MAAKVRTAVVMSIPASNLDRALVTIVPHTTSARGSRFEAAVAAPFLRAGVFDAQNLVTIPHAKLIRNLGKLSPAQLAVVEQAVIRLRQRRELRPSMQTYVPPLWIVAPAACPLPRATPLRSLQNGCAKAMYATRFRSV
jgi:mRNA interferase MazF